MNIFILDEDLKKAAEYHCDVHCIKQILELAQLVSTAVWVTHPDHKDKIAEYRKSVFPLPLYKPTHINHPVNKWVRENKSNFLWAYHFGIELCAEYNKRYGKIHKSLIPITNSLQYQNLFPNKPLSPFAQCMPEAFRSNNTVTSYRNYYAGAKFRFAKWDKLNNEPFWWNQHREFVKANNLEVVNEKDDGINH